MKPPGEVAAAAGPPPPRGEIVPTMVLLKRETRDVHTACERTPFAQALLHGRLTRPAYRAQLAAYRTMHGAVEEALSSSTAPCVAAVFHDDLRKVPWLESDLRALEGVRAEVHPAVREALGRLVDGVLALSLEGRGLLGALYVVEGSSLGAAFMLPGLRASLGLSAGETRYYAGYGAETPERWRTFTESMNHALPSPADAAAAVTGARAFFHHVHDLMTALGYALEGPSA